MLNEYHTYIITNKANTVLYTGVTSDLRTRIWQHKQKLHVKSFSAGYNCNKLVYYETFIATDEAITKEKQLKAGSRKRKIDLVLKSNPGWKDLSETWYND
ncbi:GIY-YIG nuclease family protein [Mucilaginibacter ginkgonis]|uniref:GIY-YIG nuclease family protein n=1 Tax=Mucilaginibacter ginkgonis TaxID=2682091 RepID=A0A6I4I342_9SPHI|nr:GIY-YIG nuclease family protein [Mucilaginibacter ginkgonis]QQL49714.1 GIY-YIG nuclease family protein [Mucilaginibacter ginkgonis]